MSYILDDFEIYENIDQSFKYNIQYFYVFDTFGINAIFVTNDDKVFALGSNDCGVLGLGHNNAVNEPIIIPELCHKNINQFFNGRDFVLAFNSSNNQLYGWGMNDVGQLGRGYISHDEEYLKPQIIELNEITN